MSNYSKSQILASVVSEWVRPAISQLTAANLMRIPMLQSLQATIGSLGLVSGQYSLQADITPLIQPIVNNIVTPMLCRWFENVPDESIPKMAHDVVEQMKQQGCVSLLEGTITLDSDDLEELSDLLHKNLPVEDAEGYQVIH